MDAAALTAVAHQIARRLCGSHEALRIELIRLLAEGRSVPIATLAERLGQPLATVAAIVQHCGDTEFDDTGHIVGWGLTLTPTVHQFKVGGITLYTWCALDTLMYPALLGQTAEVRSTCPVSGAPVALVVGPEHVTDVEPAAAAVSVVLPDQAADACSRASFCAHGHYFASLEGAEAWQKIMPSTLVIPVVKAAYLARSLSQERQGRAFL
jgi:alkylmercury lyase